MPNEIKTDSRLLNIIESGRRFLSAKDPEQILGPVTPTMLAFDIAVNKWKMNVVFPNGAKFVLEGETRKDKYVITKVHIMNALSQWETIPMADPSETLLKSLGDVSRVPGRLKRYLSREAVKTANTAIIEYNPEEFMKDARSALFFKVEDEKEFIKTNPFNYWQFTYILTEYGDIYKTEVQARTKKGSGIISISVDADIYGISNKKVTLIKKLGQDRSAYIDCRKKEKTRIVPSLTVACDLNDLIKEIYTPERVNDLKKTEQNTTSKKTIQKTK